MVTTIADVPLASIRALLGRYDLALHVQADGETITGSFWGDSEAGIVAKNVYVRNDTPVHSLLHETCHVICMSAERRADLETDAGGDDLEEAAVCYLQVVLADHISGVGRQQLMNDMDAWGYSFRLGSTRPWFERDAEDARKWLIDHQLLDTEDAPSFRLRA
jgi:hypothetical protein